MEFVALFVIAVVISMLVRSYRKWKRRKWLMAKYGSSDIVDGIMRRMFWQGQTAEQLFDSIGHPTDVDRKVLKTKSKEIWKYNRTGKGRFGLRITVENGLVVGWDKKA
ncbi:DUF2845 domain-containing protein [Pseudomonas sp.]|uniref:DUF2845 domain-containing protein n=1 Tax=Pseudomonas sp. TaxID=306 RepID=UPI00258577BD|nr:DUF2845 domain-containing protein [Pseudomonas sp.]